MVLPSTPDGSEAFASPGSPWAEIMPGSRADERDGFQTVREAAEGSSDAFTELLAPFRVSLFAYLLRACGHRTVAEDLLQETLLHCWRALPQYDDRGRFAAWLFTIARNTVRDAQRDHARKQVIDSTARLRLLNSPADTLDPESDMELRQRTQRAQEALNGLPEHQREVFLLRAHGNLTFRDIATQLDQPLGTVLSHMHRAVKKIKKEIA